VLSSKSAVSLDDNLPHLDGRCRARRVFVQR
jgi:hypothetical protein